MRRFERKPDGTLEALLDAEEAVLLQSLAGQVAELVSDGTLRQAQGVSTSSTSLTPDVALARLLPDAYPDDPEASAEFRRFTAGGLAERKVGNAETLIRSLDGTGVTGRVILDESEALSWLRCLTDIRLTIASRLGIESEDDDAGRTIDPLMREIYDWLGFVQNSLIEALDDRVSHG
ncbi:DUF2017 domain-containing protein [Homoserinimonas sp. A520]